VSLLPSLSGLPDSRRMDDTEHPDTFPPLTIEQIRELAAAIGEIFGSNLPRMDFTDKLLLFLEDVPGYETDAADTSLIDSAWAEYARRDRGV